MSTQQKKSNYSWLVVVAAIFAIYFLATGIMNSGPSKHLDYNVFMDKLGYDGILGDEYNFTYDENEYFAIIMQGNYFYVLSRENGARPSQAKIDAFLENFKSKCDIIVYSTHPNLTFDLLVNRNAKAPTAADKFEILDARPISVNVFESYVLPILYFVLIGTVIFFMYRNFAGRGGIGSMGRHRATRILGGSLRFSDVAGIDEEKEEVQELVDFLRNPKKFLDLGARIPKGCLLVGAPGTGKTLLAKAIAGEANVPFLSISGSDFSEMLVGVGPSRMRDLFEEAKVNAPCIIFIDEIDSIARMRGVGVSGVSDENEQTLNQLLVQMDGFTKSEGVIVLAATNRPDVLDQALLRPGRFDRQIIVQMPDVRGREKILEVHCKNKPIGTDVDLKRVAKIISGFTGADIENLMNESAIIAAKKNKTRINMADITEGINKVLLGPQKRSRIITDEDKKITAFHEAGHAVISRVLQPTHMVQEVSIIPRGMAAGYTLTNDKDIESHHKGRKFLNAEIVMLMGGRVAEDIFIGDTCTGSTNDLKHATILAENMVTKYGMSEKLGPLYYGKSEEIAIRMYENDRHSEVLQSTIDNEIKSIILAGEKNAREILKSNAEKVKVMANVLLERETIYAEDIDVIMLGKDEKAVIAEMELREQAAKTQEKNDRIENEIATLEKQLGAVLETAGVLLENKLIGMEKYVKLQDNMKLARDIVRSGENLEHIPTLDNLESYGNLVNSKPKTQHTGTKVEPQKPAQQTANRPKPRQSKKTKGASKNESPESNS